MINQHMRHLVTFLSLITSARAQQASVQALDPKTSTNSNVAVSTATADLGNVHKNDITLDIKSAEIRDSNHSYGPDGTCPIAEPPKRHKVKRNCGNLANAAVDMASSQTADMQSLFESIVTVPNLVASLNLGQTLQQVIGAARNNALFQRFEYPRIQAISVAIIVLADLMWAHGLATIPQPVVLPATYFDLAGPSAAGSKTCSYVSSIPPPCIQSDCGGDNKRKATCKTGPVSGCECWPVHDQEIIHPMTPFPDILTNMDAMSGKPASATAANADAKPTVGPRVCAIWLGGYNGTAKWTRDNSPLNSVIDAAMSVLDDAWMGPGIGSVERVARKNRKDDPIYFVSIQWITKGAQCKTGRRQNIKWPQNWVHEPVKEEDKKTYTGDILKDNMGLCTENHNLGGHVDVGCVRIGLYTTLCNKVWPGGESNPDYQVFWDIGRFDRGYNC